MLYFGVIVTALEAVLLGAVVLVALQTLRQPPLAEPSRRRALAGDILLRLATAVFFISGVTKLLHLPFAVQEMTLLHLTGWKYDLVAAVELTSGVLISIRPLRSIALLFISAHCGGAICAHLIAGQEVAMVPSAMVMTVTWLGAFLRHPQMLWSLAEFGERRTTAPAVAQVALRARV